MEQIAIKLSDVLVLALKLSTRERLQLIERVAASVEGEIALPKQDESTERGEHWGRNLNALLASLDMSEWEQIDDPVEWLKQQREAETRHRLGDWGLTG